MVSKRLHRLLSTVALLGVCFCLGPYTSAAGDPFLGYDGPVYPNPVISTLGNEPWEMLQGDFNEDGLEDLAVIGEFALVILLGNGDCTFSRTYISTFGGGSGVIGDFNQDNHQDLAFGTQGITVKVLLGNGDGTFGPPTALTQPLGVVLPLGFAIADFNEDNHEDLLAGFYSGSGGFAFWAGNGDGTFEAAVTFGGPSVWDIGVADFDENGQLDFIAGNNTPQVQLGAGNGTFAAAGSFPVGDQPEGLLVFDFNGDIHADFATANYLSDDVSVRLGNGDGTFAADTRYPVGARPRYLAIADVDNDGDVELFVGYASEAYVSMLPGNGDGTFGAESRIATVNVTGPIVIADFDDDGRLDLAVASQIWDEVVILRGHGDGTFVPFDPAYVRSAGPTPFEGSTFLLAASFGDVNKDGLQDAVLLRPDAIPNAIAVMVADGTGAFTTSAEAEVGTGPSDVAIGDVNNDTHPDVITANFGSNDASILLGNGDGTFAPAFSSVATRDPISIASGLFNNDGNVDLAFLSLFPSPAIHVLLGNGNATFLSGGISPVGPGATLVETGDFDEDGVTDLVVVNNDSSDLSVLIGVGDGSFEPEVRYGFAVTSSQAILTLTVADVDADGHQDLVVPFPGDVVLYGAGDGTFGPATSLGMDEYSWIYAFGDVNGDGRTDLVGAFSQLLLRLGQPDGSFGETMTFAGGGRPKAMILEDTDGEGRLDVVQVVGNGVSVLLNVEPAVFNFLNDKITLRWPDVDGALSYNVYRGPLSDLVDGDDDGLPDMGYGDCQNDLDPDTTDLNYVDASVPAPNSGYFYVIAVVDWAGERYLGTTSAGLPRVPALPCP